MEDEGGGAWPEGGASLEEECEVVRVRVKKSGGLQPPEFRSFALDPRLTTLDVLQRLLARAFDLPGTGFAVSFAARDRRGRESFAPLSSDRDLAAAFASAARPALRLHLELRPPESSPLLEDWDVISPREAAGAAEAPPGPERRSLLAAALPLTQALLAQVSRTLARAQAALAWPEASSSSPSSSSSSCSSASAPPPPPDSSSSSSPPPPAAPPPPPPLGDADLRRYLGPGGRLVRPRELRLHVYHGGVEPGLRKVVWRYLLNVFPGGLTGQERLSHLRRQAAAYGRLKALLPARAPAAEVALVTAAVREDVLRTDRGHPYFGGPAEGHPHLGALAALLRTFALAHPRLSYCQGMSEVAAPLLAVLDDEAQAYVCFCALMRRLAARFRPRGRALPRAFAQLRRLLRRHDPDFWAFLAARGAHDLLFCYRWLLLELKREFAFEDALRLMEVAWSSLPPAPPPPPHGVPLLGAPLGARRARAGFRERRAMRPPPPRRARTDAGAPRGPREEPRGLREEPRSPRSLQEEPKSPRSLHEEGKGPCEEPKSPRSLHEEPRSLHEEPRSLQEEGKSPRSLHEEPRSLHEEAKGLREEPEGPRELQEDPKSLQEGPKNPKNLQEDPKSSGKLQEELGQAPAVPKKVGQDPSVLKKDGQDLNVPKVIGQDLSVPKVVGQDPDTSKNVDQEPDVSKVFDRDPTVFKKVGQDLDTPKDVDQDPSVPKELHEDPNTSKDIDQDLNIPKAVGQDLNMPKDIDQDPNMPKAIGQDPSIPRAVGQDPNTSKDIDQDPSVPKEFDEDPNTCKELDEDPATSKDIGQDPCVPKELDEDPSASKDIDQDPNMPKEIDQDPGVPTELHEDPATSRDTEQDPGSPLLEDPWSGAYPWDPPSSPSSSSSSSSSSEEEELALEDDGAPLPPPAELGQGHPFVLFVCVAMLLEQRGAVMAAGGDYNDVAMHFDRLVRRHPLRPVLRRARALFARYLQAWGGGAGL